MIKTNTKSKAAPAQAGDHMPNLWYVGKTGNHQGLIIEDKTGRNIAVSYDKADAPLIASAPALMAERDRLRVALKELVRRNEIMLEYERQGRTITTWTSKEQGADGDVANHRALDEAVRQAVAALTPLEVGK